MEGATTWRLIRMMALPALSMGRGLKGATNMDGRSRLSRDDGARLGPVPPATTAAASSRGSPLRPPPDWGCSAEACSTAVAGHCYTAVAGHCYTATAGYRYRGSRPLLLR